MRPAPIGGLGITGLLLRTSLLAAATLLALLLTAQLVRLRPAGIDLDPTLLGLALVALLEPALPLVLEAWEHTPAPLKTLRLAEHIEWAAAHGALDRVAAFLRALPEEEWLHAE